MRLAREGGLELEDRGRSLTGRPGTPRASTGCSAPGEWDAVTTVEAPAAGERARSSSSRFPPAGSSSRKAGQTRSRLALAAQLARPTAARPCAATSALGGRRPPDRGRRAARRRGRGDRALELRRRADARGRRRARCSARFPRSSGPTTSSAPAASPATSGRSRRTRSERVASRGRGRARADTLCRWPMAAGFEKFLRFGEGRRMKRLAEQAAYIATLEPDFQRALRRRAAREDGRVPRAARERRGPERPPLRGVRRRARGAPARVRPAHVRRADDGRHRPPRGRRRRDEDRRGQDVRREPRALPERAPDGRAARRPRSSARASTS